MGFYEGGMARFSEGRFSQLNTVDGLPAGVITDLHLDRQGRLWLSSSIGGVSHIDDRKTAKLQIVTLTITDGLSSNNTRTITEDNFGNIYVGSVRGVDRISADTKRIKHYSVADGLAADFVTDSHCDKAGVLWFATMNGLSRLVPRAAEKPVAPTIWLGGLRVAGVAQPVSELGQTTIETPELAHTQNNLEVDFFGLDFRAGENLRYQYLLEGADTKWSAPAEQRTVTYGNLRPGNYRFRVRAVNSEGLASEQPATLTFRILPPLWLRWWFITTCLVFTGVLFFALYSYRMARLREINGALMDAKLAEENLRKAKEERLVELEQVRKRIATDLHDDIGASLTRISLLSEVAQRRQSSVEPAGNNSLSVIAGLARELVDSMSDIVWAINPERDSLGDLTQRMRRFAGDVFSARGIDFQFHQSDFGDNARVGANFRREIFLIFKEAVNNAVRHSECSDAEIEFKLMNGALFLKVSDNGRGFDVENKSNGHGLASMRARIERLGGEMNAVSAQDKGSALAFTVPVGKSTSQRVVTEKETGPPA
jgi:signal transduction histidine kinase